MEILRTMCCVMCFLLLLTGCTKSIPKLEKFKWVEVEVEYCVGEGKQVQKRTWKSNEPNVLIKLRDAYVVKSWKHLSVGGYMRTNEIRIKGEDGTIWILYLYAPHGGRLRDYYQPLSNLETKHNVSFISYWVDLDPSFYNTLKPFIEQYEGTDIHLFYDQEVDVVADRK